MDCKKINSILMRVLAVLLMLVLVTSGMVSGRYARYVTTATYEDSARVAKFNIVETRGAALTQIPAKIAPGEVTEYISVRNYSEVAVEFTIKVESPYKNIPLKFRIVEESVENGETVETVLEETEKVNEPLTFNGTIGPGQTEKQYRLVIVWPEDPDNIDYIGRVDLIQVTLNAVQVD